MTSDEEYVKDAIARDPLSWWNAPGYTEARRRLLDALELLPRPVKASDIRPGSGESQLRHTWWVNIATLGMSANHAAEMGAEEREALVHNPPEAAVDAVNELADLAGSLQHDQAEVTDGMDDERIPRLAGLMLHILDAEPFLGLLSQLGWRPDIMPSVHGPGDTRFGRLVLADILDSSWFIWRAYNANTIRGF